IIKIPGRDAQLLGVDHSVKRIVDDVEPATVPLAYGTCKRFTRMGLLQQDVVVALITQGTLESRQGGQAVEYGIATIGQERSAQLLAVRERHRCVAQLMLAEELAQI